MRISDWSSDVCSSDLLGAKRTFIGLSQAAGTSGSGRAAEGVGDGVAAVAAEGAAGDLHARASLAALVLRQLQHAPDAVHQVAVRSEERRVGKEGVRTCRSRGSPYH